METGSLPTRSPAGLTPGPTLRPVARKVYLIRQFLLVPRVWCSPRGNPLGCFQFTDRLSKFEVGSYPDANLG